MGNNTQNINELPTHSPDPVMEEKKKKKKRKILFILIFFLFSIPVATGVSLGVLLGKDSAPINYISVTIDPIIVNQTDETHVNGAETFKLDLTNGSTDFTKDLDVNLTGEEYLKYFIEIKNDKTEKVNWRLSLNILENEGFIITYIIDENEQTFPIESVINGEILLGQTQTIEIIFKIKDKELSSGKIAGELTFTASMIEV